MTDPAPLEPADALPAAYAPFLSVLERLSDPLQQMLRGQLLQFERDFRLSDHEQLANQGEFEGLGGLTTRGDVSHIVQSELLLRTQAPLEFLRRLAESETLFHEKIYADPGARHVYRVMISIGPGLLGHGRILALAALFFVARAAHQRHASFHWCVLPGPGRAVWFDDLSVNTVKRFLRAAAFREMTIEDCAEAAALRDEFAGMPDRDVRISDWMIGAQPSGRAGQATDIAIRHADNSLGFALAAPVAGQPRTAQMFLRQNGWERPRATIAFPDDRVCVSALVNPFQPFKPPTAEPGTTGSIPGRTGWAQRHLWLPHPNVKVVRLREGVLILHSDKLNFVRKWFVPLHQDVVLAGIRIELDLELLLHSQDDSGDLLTYYLFSLPENGAPVALLRRQKRSTTNQLFRNHDPHALPVLTAGEALEFYSVSGRPFQLRFDRQHQAVEMASSNNPAAILLATGAHRIFRGRSGERPTLRAMRAHRARDEFVIPDDLPKQFHGMIYSPGERGLAYSVRAGTWVLPSFANGDRKIVLKAGETLLSARWHHNGVAARIWSDARYGGEGTVRTVKRDEQGVETSGRPALKLGADALSIDAIQLADDGIWSVVVDEQGWPATLLRHRFGKRSSRYDEWRHDLNDFRHSATLIDLSRFRG